MSAVIKRFWRGTLEEPTADNDPITIDNHKTLDMLAEAICSANCRLLAARTALVEAQDAVGQALSDKALAELKFIQRCSEKFDLEIPLPKHGGHGDE